MPHPTHLFIKPVAIAGLGAFLLISAACQHLEPNAERQLSPAQQAASSAEIQRRGGTDALNTVSSSAIEKMRYQRFEQMLQGRLPGVRVVKTGNGGYSIRIRGAGDFQGGGDPLFLLDGMEISSASLININPAHVERIRVIKDGTAAAYGIKGANGVILITSIRP